jgi:hypothetical protein
MDNCVHGTDARNHCNACAIEEEAAEEEAARQHRQVLRELAAQQKPNGHKRWSPEAHAAYTAGFSEINRLRDALARAEMKNTLVNDVLRAVDASVAAYEGLVGQPPPQNPIAVATVKSVRTWRDAGKPGLIDP